MRIRKNGKVVRLTESDLIRITRKVLREQKGPEANIDSLGIQQNSRTQQDVAKAINGGSFDELEDKGLIKIDSDGKGQYFQILKKMKGMGDMITGTGGTRQTLSGMLDKARVGAKYYYKGSEGGGMS